MGEAAFEQRWASRESELKECEGFVFFTMLRRDAKEADDGFNYISTTVWKDRASFKAWREGVAFKRAHGEGKVKPAGAGADAKAGGPPKMFSTPPSVAVWEGKLMLTSEMGG